MPLDNFDYEGFAKNMATQAKDVIPNDIDENGKAYITNLVFNYCHLAGEALANDPQGVLDTEQAQIVCQFIGEWTFHKAIDVIRGDIPIQVRDETLQKVAFTVFEISKLALSKGMPLDSIISLVEEHVKKAFSEAVADLSKKGIINEEVAQKTISQSNIDAMVQEMNEEKRQQQAAQAAQVQPPQVQQEVQQSVPQRKNENRTFKLASLALVLKNMPPQKAKSILRNFNKSEADAIIQYMNMPDLQNRLDSTIAIKCLKEIKRNIPKDQISDIEKLEKRIKTIVNNSSSEQLSSIIRSERENIKKIINDKKYTSFETLPPKVATIFYRYLEEKVRT